LGYPEAELSLTLVGDRAMARLNRETFGRRGPTNVIAFPVDFGEVVGGGGQGVRPPDSPLKLLPPQVLGEVVISLETTQRQAQESGWPFEELFDFYLIHGILHLLGYDHDTSQADAAMEAKAWELMDVIDKYLA
jgi:probable rRNA maturation factor